MSIKKYTIQELSDLTDLSRRTIRYYIQRGILHSPLGNGRGSYYNEEHLARLIEIRDLQLKGVSLSDMNDPRASTPKPKELPLVTEQWTRIIISSGIELHLCNHHLNDEQLETIRHTIALLLPFNKESS